MSSRSTQAINWASAFLGGYLHVVDKFGASWFRRAKRVSITGTPIDMHEPEKAPLPSLEMCISKRKDAVVNAF